MHVTKCLLLICLICPFVIEGYAVADQLDSQKKLWIRRTVESAVAMATAPDQPDYEKEFSVDIACHALGQIGCVEEALAIVAQAGLEELSKIRQRGMVSLADGLSTADHVEEALKIAESVENEHLRGVTFNSVAIRQSQRGDFNDAEDLLDRIPIEAYRDRAIKQICLEYAKIPRFEDARRLSTEISDPKVLSEVQKEIEIMSTRPAVTDPDYVEFQLAAARNGPFGSRSNPELKFLKHYYQAEVALELGNQSKFVSESKTAQQLAESLKDNDGALLLLGRLMFRAGKQDDSKSLYSLLLHNYSLEYEVNPFDLDKLVFGSGPNSDAGILARCMTDEESKKALESVLHLKSATIVASPLFGAVVILRNPTWAEEMYVAMPDLKVKASMASNCLLALADQSLRPNTN